MAIANLTQQQGFAFIVEMESARNLLAYGLRVVRAADFLAYTRDPILTTLSIGAEKLLKLALGLHELDQSGSWPSKKVMQKEFGHGVLDMSSRLRTVLLSGTRDKPYPAGLLAAVDADVVLPKVLQTLDFYGRFGRFYYLDALGDQPQLGDSPASRWDEIEAAALDADPLLRSAYFASLHDNAAFERVMSDLRGSVADRLLRWWEAIAVAGRLGVLGDAGKTFGFEVHPDMVVKGT